MEDNIQTIIIMIISVFLLFIFPVYLAYEKKDDISYALAMRYTQDLVDEVRSKGYISKYMYEDYRSKLKVTGNTYDVQMTHEYNRYDPITNYYKVEDKLYTLVKTTTQEEKEEYEKALIVEAINKGKLTEESTDKAIEEYIGKQYKDQGIDKVEDTYKISKQVYSTDHILNVLESEKKLLINSSTDTVKCSDNPEVEDDCQYAYTMNVDDNFNVTIKNTNTTLATIVYNMVTANTLDNNTRIYVNYGGSILSSKWFGDIDYAMMKHDNITLDKFEKTVIFLEKRKFDPSNGENNPTEDIVENYNDEYAIAFDVRPNETTDLREKGIVTVADYTKYNFALGNKTLYNADSMLSVSVGINGISMVVSNSTSYKASTSQSLNLPYYDQPVQRKNAAGQTYIDYVRTQRKITDYSKATFAYQSSGKIKVVLTGKSGVANHTGYILVSDNNNILSGLTKEINNPTATTVSVDFGSKANRGTNTNCKIVLSNSTISINATKYRSNEITILSYPVAINNYVNIKIEMNKNESDKYIVALYIDGEKVDESIEMDISPKIDSVGMTYIGNEQRYFDGYIKNVELYNQGGED